MSRRKNRTRRFGDVVVAVAREESPDGIGSIVIHGDHRYRLPHWPSRFQAVEAMPHGGLNITFTDGSRKAVDPRFDAVLAESEQPAWTAAQIGQLRYLVHTFDRWPGDARQTIRRLTEAGVAEPNATYEWLRGQAGSVRQASVAARVSEARLPGVTVEQVESLVEQVRAETRIEPGDVLAMLNEADNVPDGLTFADPSQGQGPSDPDADGDQDSPNCGACSHFVAVGTDPDGDGDIIGNCSLFDWPVDDTLVCSAFDPADDSDNPAENVDNNPQAPWTESAVRARPGAGKPRPSRAGRLVPSGVRGYDNLRDGKPRNVEAMGLPKLRHFATHPDTHPELRKRVRAELRKRGEKIKESGVSVETRRKHATIVRSLPGGGKKHMFPIFNEQSARSALKLINHSDLTAGEKAKVRRKAQQYVEMEATAGLDHTFARIAERDGELQEAAITECVAEIREALASRDTASYAPLMERWLALHGDGGRVREDAGSLVRALDRAQSCMAEADPKPRISSEVERRVIEAQRGVYHPGWRTPLEIAESATRRDAEVIELVQPSRFKVLPSPDQRTVTSSIREASADAEAPTFDRVDLARLPIDDLREMAYDAYVAGGDTAPDGFRRIKNAGSLELVEVIESLRLFVRHQRLLEASSGPIRITASQGTPSSTPYERDTSDEDDLDAMIAASADSFRRFEDSLAARAARDTPPAPQRPSVGVNDAAVPGWARYATVTDPALEAARAMLMGPHLRLRDLTLEALHKEGRVTIEAVRESAQTAALSSTHAPIGKGGKNWITQTAPGNTGQLPAYIQNIRNAIMRSGKDESTATAIAIGTVKRWARGGGKVGKEVKAAAAKAVAEWEALRGKSKVLKVAKAADDA